MTKKVKSRHDEFIESLTPKQKEEYDKEFKELVISEMILAAKENDQVAVKKLAKMAGLTPAMAQKICRGSKYSC